jgi:hypothetical protein
MQKFQEFVFFSWEKNYKHLICSVVIIFVDLKWVSEVKKCQRVPHLKYITENNLTLASVNCELFMI